MTSLFTLVNTQLADKVKATTCESESHIDTFIIEITIIILYLKKFVYFLTNFEQKIGVTYF